MKFIDLSGMRYGRLTVLKKAEKQSQRHILWVCRCDCGKTVIVQGNNLRSGHTKSCGCIQQENRKQVNRKHGMSHKRIHDIWCHIKQRCNNSNDPAFKDYGGRGIKVCPEWEDNFQAFYDWSMANGYRDDLTIDRIDNDGDYCPENCRWVSINEQANNKRSNRRIVFNGEEMTLAQASRRFGIKRETIANRLNNGWSVEKALTIKPNMK